MSEYRKTEYQVYKRLLFDTAEVSSKTTMQDVNVLIADANRSAFGQLDDEDREHVRQAMDRLHVEVKGMFGDVQALELLAAVGDCLNGKERVSDEDYQGDCG
jgi:hypothetical protein